jgi:hypothetical protein
VDPLTESVTVTLRLYVPAAVGVPLSTPPAVKLSPGMGESMLQLYGDVPPVAVNVTELNVPVYPNVKNWNGLVMVKGAVCA